MKTENEKHIYAKKLMRYGLAAVLLLPACKKAQNETPSAIKVNPNTSAHQFSNAFNSGNGDAAFTAFNNAFLVNTGGQTYYKKSISDGSNDGTWTESLDILIAEDAYERSGDPATKTLVNNLCTTWLNNTPMPWTWDGWNDDIGWFSLALIRGYQITNNATFLNAAKYGFDMAFARGWDTQYNGGGIWEQQPDMTPAGQPIAKEALSNNSLGKVAALIYMSTGDQSYLAKSQQIYDWVWHHLYNSTTGAVYNNIDRSNTVNTSTAVYSQGTFVDYANYLYQITGNVNYFNDAKRSIDYVKNNMTTNGIITNTASYLVTWADEFARGLGHFVRDNRQWSTYYPWMVQNANAIWANRRTDYNITWNGWDQATPTDNTLSVGKFESAVAWLLYTPGSQPDNIAGSHFIVSAQNSKAIDNKGVFTNGGTVVQWTQNSGQNQKWLFTQNADNSWNIISEQSWLALDVTANNAANGTTIDQWTPTRAGNQRWWVDVQTDGTYKIWCQSTSGCLDNSSNPTDGYKIVEWGWNGGQQQRWKLQ